MLTTLGVSGMRGILEGQVEGMGPLVVLVGPNGCGKSTLLDALLIGAGNHPGDGIGRCVRRRPYSWNGSRWLFSRQNEDRSATITVRRRDDDHEEHRSTLLRWTDAPPSELERELSERRMREPFSAVSASIDLPGGHTEANVAFAADNVYRSVWSGQRITGWEIRLIDSPQGANQALDEVYSVAVERGRKDEAVAALRAVLGEDVRDITLLTDNQVPVVHVVQPDGSTPVFAMGEGVVSLVRISLELAARPGGVVLLEEPEAHQHPRIVWQTAQVAWAAVRRGVQIILSTHSLDLVDGLLAHAPPGMLDDLVVYRLKLDRGRLLYDRIPGTDVAAMRTDFEDDLR